MGAQPKKKKSIVVTSGCTYIYLPTPLRVHTLNYLGETQEELRTLTVVSKKFNEDCKQTGIEWNIIPTIIVSPLEHNGGQTFNLFRSFRDKHRLLQRYRLMIVKKFNEFNRTSDDEDDEIERMTSTFRMGILSLDLSFSSFTTSCCHDLPSHLSRIAPNLQELNLSCCTNFRSRVLKEFSERCPRLEKITWNNISADRSWISVDGQHMELAHNLRVLIMDDSVFYCNNKRKLEEISDLNNHRINSYSINAASLSNVYQSVKQSTLILLMVTAISFRKMR